MKVFCWDQAMANTGWAYLEFRSSPSELNVMVLDKGKIVTEKKDGKKGFYDTIPRGDSIFRLAIKTMHTVTGVHGEPQVFVHEMPSVMGKASASAREAPVLAVTALRCALFSTFPNIPVVIQQNQRMKKILTGVATAEKSEVKVAVLQVLGLDSMRSNEHEIDAIALGIAAYRDGLLHEAIHEGRGTSL